MRSRQESDDVLSIDVCSRLLLVEYRPGGTYFD